MHEYTDLELKDRELNYAMDRYAYLLECQLATYERARSVKRTSKSELERHRSIIIKALTQMGTPLAKHDFRPSSCVRVKQLVELLKHRPSVEQAFEAYDR